MVNFAVFNELSLPFERHEDIHGKFDAFFRTLKELKDRRLNIIRMDRNFTEYEIIDGVMFHEFLGRLTDREFKRKIKTFITNGITIIDSPLIKMGECDEQESEYFYNGILTNGGLASCDIWNTVSVSFQTSANWNAHNVVLKKHFIAEDNALQTMTVNIRHLSNTKHIASHAEFFDAREQESRLAITKENFWSQREEFFGRKIVFCEEVKAQIEKLEKNIFAQVISILRDIETNRKTLADFTTSGESETVENNQAMRAQREFMIDGEKIYFEKHIKNLSGANRIHFAERGDKIYIGYIGKHLTTKKFS